MELEIKRCERPKKRRDERRSKVDFAKDGTGIQNRLANLLHIVQTLKNEIHLQKTRVPVGFCDLLYDLEVVLSNVVDNNLSGINLQEYVSKARTEYLAINKIVDDIEKQISTKDILVRQAVNDFGRNEIMLFEDLAKQKPWDKDIQIKDFSGTFDVLLKPEMVAAAKFMEFVKTNGLPKRINTLKSYIYCLCVEDFLGQGYEYLGKNKFSFFREAVESLNWSARDYSILQTTFLTLLMSPVVPNIMLMAMRHTDMWKEKTCREVYEQTINALTSGILADYQNEIQKGFMMESLNSFKDLSSTARTLLEALSDFE